MTAHEPTPAANAVCEICGEALGDEESEIWGTGFFNTWAHVACREVRDESERQRSRDLLAWHDENMGGEFD